MSPMSYSSRFRTLRRILQEFEELEEDDDGSDTSARFGFDNSSRSFAPQHAGGGIAQENTGSTAYWGSMPRDRGAGGATAYSIVVAAARPPIFPVYLLPSVRIPFRRRRDTDSSEETRRRRRHDDSGEEEEDTSPCSSAATSPAGSPPSGATTTTTTQKGDAENSYGGFATPAPLADGSRPGRRLERTKPDTLRCSSCSADVAFGHQIISKGFTGRYGRAYLVSPPLSESELSSSPSATMPSSSSSPPGASAPSPPPKDLVNVRVGKLESRQLVTGWHTVADITCVVCQNKLGWKYVDAKDASQKYKVGKFILETERVVGFRSWDDVEAPLAEGRGGGNRRSAGGSGDGGVEGAAQSRAAAGIKVPWRRGNNRQRKSTDEAPRESDGEEEEVEFDSDDSDECEDIFAGTWDREAVAKRRSKRVSKKRHSSDRSS